MNDPLNECFNQANNILNFGCIENLRYATLYDKMEKIYAKKLLNYNKAKDFFEKSLKIKEKFNKNYADCLHYIGCLLINEGKYREARKTLEESLKMRKVSKYIIQDLKTADTLQNIAFVFNACGKYDQAIEKYKEALEIYKNKQKSN